jgi:UDPglucose 6-dehydrogenase
MNDKIGICGLGAVGNALYNTFIKKNCIVYGYDKYKNIGHINNFLDAEILFLCLPTPSENSTKEIYAACTELSVIEYKGIIVIKSTVPIGTTKDISNKFKNLTFVHNPEFLSMKTAEQDFETQKHIVIGGNNNDNDNDNIIYNFYKRHFPDAEISVVSSDESESMKLFCNSFYSVKIQFFTELYLLCNTMNIDYNKVRDLMLKNDWINPMHTNVPGTDGQISYGGMCFPKDTAALIKFAEQAGVHVNVVDAAVKKNTLLRLTKT